MKHTTIRASADGLHLAVAFVEPETAPKGLVQLVHGMCEHKERYFPFMEFLASNGYVCVIHDHRGHGESVLAQEDLGYMYEGGWKALVGDVEVVRKWTEDVWPALEHTLFGHSMGSMVVRSYIKRYDCNIDRLFVCGSPSANPVAGIGKVLAKTIGLFRGDHFRSNFLQSLSFSTYNKPFENEGYASAWVCSDKQTLEDYHHDSLCQFIFTTNGFSNLMSLMKDCYSPKGWVMNNPDLPIFFMSGEFDPCRGTDAQHQHSIDLMHEIGYLNINSVVFPGMRHEVLNETKKQDVRSHVLNCLGRSKEQAFWLEN